MTISTRGWRQLLARHPTQEDSPRWVDGLERELGQPHPADTLRKAKAGSATTFYFEGGTSRLSGGE